ncbi:hypothetical protein Bbelb_296430 [Branchiostoma belcheri]|nr:hypothetical protein Bbelb_296430 [Branchiostoma belcheri]
MASAAGSVCSLQGTRSVACQDWNPGSLSCKSRPLPEVTFGRGERSVAGLASTRLRKAAEKDVHPSSRRPAADKTKHDDRLPPRDRGVLPGREGGVSAREGVFPGPAYPGRCLRQLTEETMLLLGVVLLVLVREGSEVFGRSVGGHLSDEFAIDVTKLADSEALMTQMKDLAEAVHACGSMGFTDMKLHKLRNTSVTCNDGSPAGKRFVFRHRGGSVSGRPWRRMFLTHSDL